MRPELRYLIVTAGAGAIVAMASMVLAFRMGGGGDRPSRLPETVVDAGTERPLKASAPEGGAYKAEMRLTEEIGRARIDMPNMAEGLRMVASHWRKMKSPWVRVSGDSAKLVSAISLRTSAHETQWEAPASGGKTWKPDARVWNMNEGEYDQRDAIVAPAPASITYRIAIPNEAKLSYSVATLNAARENTTFSIVVTDAKGAAKTACTKTLAPDLRREWVEQMCDLSAFAGQTVDLTLKTEASPPEAPVSFGAVAKDGGAPDVVRGGIPLGLWANPTLLSRGTSIPYNVLWIVVDALRPDVIPSFHVDEEDARTLRAQYSPIEAFLPKVPGLMPNLDALGKRSAWFRHAYSAGTWTRPGTLSMLSGARSSELGVETTSWLLPEKPIRDFYASEPPLFSVRMRRQGVITRAFVNNFFMVGYTPIGVDMGFEQTTDIRYRTRDTAIIAANTQKWLKENADTRFFLFCNFNSPHEPWEPPKSMLARVPEKPPAGPIDNIARMYMAEAAKDDEAIGQILQTLDETHLRDNTIVIVMADHGETFSSAHGGKSGLDNMEIRHHHAASNFEETSKIPLFISLPKIIPENKVVNERVRNIDLVPTLMDLLGLEGSPKTTGKSLMPLIKGEKEAEERPVISEGRGTRAFYSGKYRLLLREGKAATIVQPDKTVTVPEELFDLENDPGERHDISRQNPALLAEMKARLQAALKNAPVAGTQASLSSSSSPLSKTAQLRIRFAGKGETHRVSGNITVVGGQPLHLDKNAVAPGTFEAVGVAPDVFKANGNKIEFAFVTNKENPVGVDLVPDPPGAKVAWELYLDDRPWPKENVFGGPYGLFAPSLVLGFMNDDGKKSAEGARLPLIDAKRDFGLFVVREFGSDAEGGDEEAGEGAEEMARLLKEWGYAHGSK